ncbi:FxsA family protein [Tautonia sociabilis]|uniref:FxsA family protein n=1 Tax=Tautonia sociabilis TaxID=2080755 RepID=A0A432MGE0_9BACT|nr:FxsA family protein [Tautonia sociabilis]RUL85542.1 FxsA family protein [Tautonia sociabilis]
MFVRLLLLLTIVPVVELFVLLKVHGAIAERYDVQTGLLVTVGAILFTGVLGAYLARSQGLGVLRELQRSMAEGKFPGRTLLDGALVLVGGALLLTPGFLTDLVGLSLLVPITRAGYRRVLSAWLERKVRRGEAFVRFGTGPAPGSGRHPGSWGPGPGRGQVIDVTPDDQDRS